MFDRVTVSIADASACKRRGRADRGTAHANLPARACGRSASGRAGCVISGSSLIRDLCAAGFLRPTTSAAS